MTLKLNAGTAIDNFRNYPPELVEKLRALLASGANAEPDPRRRGFYDVENGSRMFYVHVAPGGKVWLLASWLKKPSEAAEKPAALAAICS